MLRVPEVRQMSQTTIGGVVSRAFFFFFLNVRAMIIHNVSTGTAHADGSERNVHLFFLVCLL